MNSATTSPSQGNKVLPMPARGMKAFMFYIDDWRSSNTVHDMDTYEKMGYLNLLMRMAQEPDCGLPDNDWELAIASELELAWWRPTRERRKRIGVMDPETGKQKIDERGKPVWISSGEKIRRAFSFRPKNEHTPNGRIYNERMYREYLHKNEVSEIRRNIGRSGALRKQASNCYPQEEANGVANEPQQTTLNSTIGGRETTSTSSPPPPSTDPVVVDAPPPVTGNSPEISIVDDQEYQALVVHAANVVSPDGARGVPVPSKQLLPKLKAKFPPGTPFPEILENLPRFNGQTSAGLWLTTNLDTLKMEATRQRAERESPPARKPTDKQRQDEELRQWARKNIRP